MTSLSRFAGTFGLVASLTLVAGPARAAYTVSTAVASVSGGLQSMNITSTGATFTDTAGSTFTLTNQTGTFNATGGASELINLVTPAANDSGSFTVTDNILINGTLAFAETITYNVSISGGLGVASPPTGVLPAITPTGPVMIGGVAYTITDSHASLTDTNGSTGSITATISPSAAVPEPASIAMLGLGLAGAGLVARRRRSK